MKPQNLQSRRNEGGSVIANSMAYGVYFDFSVVFAGVASLYSCRPFCCS